MQLKAPGSTKNNASLYQQVGPSGVMAWVRVDADSRGVRIGSGRGRGEVHTRSRAHREKRRPDAQPIHETACARLPADDAIKNRNARPQRPCVDARSGEELTKELVGWTIKSENGVIVERRLTKR